MSSVGIPVSDSSFARIYSITLTPTFFSSQNLKTIENNRMIKILKIALIKAYNTMEEIKEKGIKPYNSR